MRKKPTNLFCPLHGTRLYNERERNDRDPIEKDSVATCFHENCPHKVYIRDRQAYEQEGEIEICLY